MLEFRDEVRGGGGGGGGTTTSGAYMNIAGTWTTTEHVKSTTCASGIYTDTGTYTVMQSGHDLTVQDASGNTFTGTINDTTAQSTPLAFCR